MKPALRNISIASVLALLTIATCPEPACASEPPKLAAKPGAPASLPALPVRESSLI